MILKCKMCGGDITFSPGETHGQCEYCGSSCTIPKVDEEQKLNSDASARADLPAHEPKTAMLA